MSKLDAMVSARREALLAKGLKIVQWGTIDGLSKPYVIKYESGTPTPEMLKQFEVFGSGTVTFRQGEVKSLGRYNDTHSFYGGSNIVASNTNPKHSCTSGFAGRVRMG